MTTQQFKVFTILAIGLTGMLGLGQRLVSQDAAQSSLDEQFRRYDKNSDDKVTAAELGQPGLFRFLDANGDGHITLEEARSQLKKRAARDSNRTNGDNPGSPSTSPTPSGPSEKESDKAASNEAPSGREPDPAHSTAVRQGPRLLAPTEMGIGRLVPDAEFQDIDGKNHRLSDYHQSRALVVAVTSVSCPLSKKYLPTLAQLEKKYSDRSVSFLFLNATASDRIEAIRDAVRQHNLAGLYVHTSSNGLLSALEARTTTECFVLDGARTLIYRGAVDDQYGFGYSLEAPRQQYLVSAIEGLLKNQLPEILATEAPGCELEQVERPAPATKQVTYHNRISRLIETHCASCHRDGGVAPFALTSHADVVAHAPMIRQVVERGVMPPWFAEPVAASQHSPWINDRSLSSIDKSDLLDWLKSDRPIGDPQDALIVHRNPSTWQIGQPDAIFQFPRPVAVKATGTMPYQTITVETSLESDQWIRAMEIQPSAREVVHHVLVFVDGTGGGDQEEGRQGFFAAYVPGNSSVTYPEGYAKLLRKGARLRFQMHYTPNGTAVEDITRFGVRFANQEPRHEVKVAGIANSRISIPAGADNHEEHSDLRLPFDVQLMGFMPHMHVRGKACRYEVIKPGEPSETLLNVPRYDFNWQLLYRRAEPVALSAGSTIRFTSWYDNSGNNPANPDPTKTVRWGPQTFDEMQLGYIEYIVPGAKPGEGSSLDVRSRVASAITDGLFQRVDTDSNGTVDLGELKRAASQFPRFRDKPDEVERLFQGLDRDQSNGLSKQELGQLQRFLQRNQ